MAATPPPPRPSPSHSRGALHWAALFFVTDLAVWGLAWSLAPRSVPLAILVAWAATSLGVVSVLYVLAGLGRASGEVLSGDRLAALQPVFLPYRGVATALFVLARAGRRDPGAVEVIPGLWLGPRLFAHERSRLRERGVRAVLDLTCELPANRGDSALGVTVRREPLLDRTAPSDVALASLVAWTLERIAAGDAVFVHCAFGRGRSAMVAAAVVLGAGRASTVDEALAVVSKARPLARVRGDQREGLERYVSALRRRVVVVVRADGVPPV